MITKKGPTSVQHFTAKQQVTVIIMNILQAIFCFVSAIIKDYVANPNLVSVTCILKTIVAEVICSCHGGNWCFSAFGIDWDPPIWCSNFILRLQKIIIEKNNKQTTLTTGCTETFCVMILWHPLLSKKLWWELEDAKKNMYRIFYDRKAFLFMYLFIFIFLWGRGVCIYSTVQSALNLTYRPKFGTGAIYSICVLFSTDVNFSPLECIMKHFPDKTKLKITHFFSLMKLF